MGTLAIRQGDSLYFARSLVWRLTVSEQNDTLCDKCKACALDRLLTDLERFRKLDLELTQETIDGLAALRGVHPSPKLRKPVHIDVSKLDMGSPRRGF